MLSHLADVCVCVGGGEEYETCLSWPKEEIRGFTELLSVMLRTSPLERASAFELLHHPWLDVEHSEPWETIF